ncbi:MAG: hypothetical protein PF637_05265 [Spirochaetes bacterium]|jgi:hypothetical protein|nr:hypothetical protein [Spirochaetota bacterium]
MKKLSLLCIPVLSFILIAGGCSRNKELYIYTIPGEGLPVIKTLVDGEITVLTNIKDRTSEKKITVSKDTTINWSDSCVIVEKIGSAEVTQEMKEPVWLYDISSGVVTGDKEGKVSISVGDTIDVLNYQAEDYYTIKTGNKIFDLHASYFELTEEPIVSWYMQETSTEYWYLIDGINVDIAERTF